MFSQTSGDRIFSGHKTVQGFFLVHYSGSSLNGHSRKRKALLTAAVTKTRLFQLSHKLCIFTFPQAASSSYRHLFRVPRVSAYESFHCTFICLERFFLFQCGIFFFTRYFLARIVFPLNQSAEYFLLMFHTCTSTLPTVKSQMVSPLHL